MCIDSTVFRGFLKLNGILCALCVFWVSIPRLGVPHSRTTDKTCGVLRVSLAIIGAFMALPTKGDGVLARRLREI